MKSRGRCVAMTWGSIPSHSRSAQETAAKERLQTQERLLGLTSSNPLNDDPGAKHIFLISSLSIAVVKTGK